MYYDDIEDYYEYDEYEGYKVIRCGVIPYHKINNNHFLLLMGFKRNYNKYFGDFGGGIKQNEYYISGLIREIKEEANDIFGDPQNFVNNMMIRNDTRRIQYLTKSKIPSIYLEFLVHVQKYDFEAWFEEGGYNAEHKYVTWIDVIRDIDNRFIFKNISDKQIDGSIRPLIQLIFEELDTL